MNLSALSPVRGLSSLTPILFAALGLACCSTGPPGAASAAEATAVVVDCAALDEGSCLDSADCTLFLEEKEPYVCRAAASDCERGFLQRRGREEDCAEGCTYTPANCYCEPEVTCICGGGPPAMCVAG